MLTYAHTDGRAQPGQVPSEWRSVTESRLLQGLGTQCTCFTSTKVQILTQKALLGVPRALEDEPARQVLSVVTLQVDAAGSTSTFFFNSPEAAA